MAKNYLRKGDLAKRYKRTPRSIDDLVRDEILPPPDLYQNRVPLWDEGKLDAHDAAAAVSRPRPAQTDTAA